MAPPASPTSPGEILSVIKKLKKNKAPGHDGINNSTVKNLPSKIIILLTYIFNAIFRLSYFPNSWKSAMIITIPKPRKPPDTPESYRPISLLPTLGKIFEKILLKRLTAIVLKQNALPDFQFGFRANHATFHQLHRVVDYIAITLETRKYCSGLFLDVAQAFDTVWHDGLLFKLKNIFPAPYYLLLKSYLSDRNFRVKINTTLSSLQTISAGVPQGSDIAPFLYTLFTADIPTSVNTLIGTYADDIAVLSSSHDILEANLRLQNHLDILFHWFKSWKIKVNDSKSTHVTFALRSEVPPPLTFNNQIISQTNEVKYLGLVFDKRLT